MNTFLLYIAGILFPFLPETKCFRMKSFFLRLCGATIGRNVRICSSVKILGNGKLVIGDDVWIGHQSTLVSTSLIKIGSNVDIAPKVYIGTGTHEIDPLGSHSAGIGLNKDVFIEDGVWVGTSSLIMPGVTIKNKTVVAAGSVVTTSHEGFLLIGGVPAKTMRIL